MTGRYFPLITLVLLFVFALSCGGNNPLVPSHNDFSAQDNIKTSGLSNRQLFGYWNISISPDHSSATVKPVRGSVLHINARKFLENAPCEDCLKITGVYPAPGGMLNVDLQLRHPYPGFTKYTGFDVRGICMFGGDYTFPEFGVTTNRYRPFSQRASMLNPEGYTTVWNPVDFPEGSGAFEILEYSPGKFSSPIEPSTTLNPYLMYYSMEERHTFEVTASVTRTYRVFLPPGPLEFGYAVDASWTLPEGESPYSVPDDWPISANSLEPWMISVASVEGLNSGGGTGLARILIHDWQGASTVTSVMVEAPDLYDGISDAWLAEDYGDYSIWEAYLDNTHMVSAGVVDLLIRAEDIGYDEFNGPFVAWNILPVEVEEEIGPVTKIIDPQWPGRAFKIALDTENTIHAVYSDGINIYWSYSLDDGHHWVNRGALWTATDPWAISSTTLTIVADDNGYVYCGWAVKIPNTPDIIAMAGRMDPTGPDNDPDTALLDPHIVFDLSGGGGGSTRAGFSGCRIFPADDGSLMYYSMWYAGTGDFRPRYHYADDWESLEDVTMYDFDDGGITNGSMTYIYTPTTNFMATDSASNFFMAMSGRYTYDPVGLTLGSFLAKYNESTNNWTIISVYNPPGVDYWDNNHNGICIDNDGRLYWVTEYQIGGSGPYGNDTGTYQVVFGEGDLQGNVTFDDPITPYFVSSGTKYDAEFYDFSLDITDTGKLFFVYQRSPNEQNAYYIYREDGGLWTDPVMVNDPSTTGYMPYAFVAPNQKLYVCYTDLGPDPSIIDDYGYFTSIE